MGIPVRCTENHTLPSLGDTSHPYTFLYGEDIGRKFRKIPTVLERRRYASSRTQVGCGISEGGTGGDFRG